MSEEKPLIRGVTLFELVGLIVVLFLFVTAGFFWYDRQKTSYMKIFETWQKQATEIVNRHDLILNTNIQGGKLISPVVTPQLPPQKGVTK